MTPKGKVTVYVTGFICAALTIMQFAPSRKSPVQISSFTNYSDSTWQINDTVFWRRGTDTLKLDISRLK